MTERLRDALKVHRHLRSERDTGEPMTERVERRAGREVKVRIQIFQHNFCSHLAMQGAPAKAIQELARHTDLTTTMRYMHLSPSAREGAIRLLTPRREKLADVVLANVKGHA